MRPNHGGGQILEGQHEIITVINACALRQLYLADMLIERTADIKHLEPAAQEVKLTDIEFSVVLKALTAVSKLRWWQDGEDYAKAPAKEVLARYHATQTASP